MNNSFVSISETVSELTLIASAEWDQSLAKDIPFQNTKLYGGDLLHKINNEHRATIRKTFQ